MDEVEVTKVKVVNMNKSIEEVVLRVIDSFVGKPWVDPRMLAIGRTQIELGFLAVNRAIVKPERGHMDEAFGKFMYDVAQSVDAVPVTGAGPSVAEPWKPPQDQPVATEVEEQHDDAAQQETS